MPQFSTGDNVQRHASATGIDFDVQWVQCQRPVMHCDFLIVYQGLKLCFPSSNSVPFSWTVLCLKQKGKSCLPFVLHYFISGIYLGLELNVCSTDAPH